MSFTRAIGTQPPTDREIQIECPKVEQPSSGWDTLRETLWLPHPFWLPRGTVREGPAPEYGTFIVQDSRVLDYKGGRPVVEVTSLGIALQDGKDYKIECSSALNEDLSLASGTYPSPTIWRKQYPRVSKLYVSLTTPDVSDHLDVASVPPETFGYPATPWNIAWVSPTSWTAAGWIGETRNVQQLPGAKACLVNDTWLYDLGYADRDGVPLGVIYL